MKKRFESRKFQASGTAIPAPDAKIIFTKAPFIQYEQILLDKFLRQYLETIMASKENSKNGNIKNTDTKNLRNKCRSRFLGHWLFRDKKTVWLDRIILSVRQSDKLTTIYDSWNVEMASKIIKSMKLTNFTEIYSLTIEKQFDSDSLTQKHLFCKQFIAWSCNGSSVAPLTDCMNNKICQELIEEDNNFDVRSNERLYLDLRAALDMSKRLRNLNKTIQKLTCTSGWKMQQRKN